MAPNYKSTLRACYLGYIGQAIVNNLAPLLYVVFQTQYDISFEMIGRLALFNFVTQLIVDILAVKVVDRIGYRKPAVLACGASFLGLVLLGVLPQVMPTPFIGLAISVMVYAVGGGLMEVLVSPIVDSLPSEDKASSMSLLHSFYSWGQMGVILISTLLLRVIGQAWWPVLPILWSLLPLYNLFAFLRAPLRPTVEEGERTSIRKLFRSELFVVAALLMLCAGAAEMAMVQWASLFAEKGLGVSKVMGDILGPCLFALLMGLGRTGYGIWGARLKVEHGLLACALFCILCYLVTVFAPWPLLSLMGCAFCGLAVSLLWPGTLSLTSAQFPAGGATMFGLLAIFGDLGCSISPWLTGLVSDLVMKMPSATGWAASMGQSLEQLGLKSGLAVGTLFPVVMVLGLLVFHFRRKKA